MTAPAMAWSAMTSPLGRYGADTNSAIIRCVASTTAARNSGSAARRAPASSRSASPTASVAVARRSSAPAERGAISTTARPPTPVASTHPATRSPMTPTGAAADAASMYGSIAAAAPEASLGPITAA
ncbi:hypothetical protein ACFQZ4_44655 [Catellatospora coxensis]